METETGNTETRCLFFSLLFISEFLSGLYYLSLLSSPWFLFHYEPLYVPFYFFFFFFSLFALGFGPGWFFSFPFFPRSSSVNPVCWCAGVLGGSDLKSEDFMFFFRQVWCLGFVFLGLDG